MKYFDYLIPEHVEKPMRQITITESEIDEDGHEDHGFDELHLDYTREEITAQTAAKRIGEYDKQAKKGEIYFNLYINGQFYFAHDDGDNNE